MKTKKTEKKTLVEKYQTHKKDTGSVEVQVALLSQKISDLVKHLDDHANDFDSKRGLLMMVGKRRRLLNYLRSSDDKKYDKIIKDLGLRK
jgi:small subunit ribosomal protein S15